MRRGDAHGGGVPSGEFRVGLQPREAKTLGRSQRALRRRGRRRGHGAEHPRGVLQGRRRPRRREGARVRGEEHAVAQGAGARGGHPRAALQARPTDRSRELVLGQGFRAAAKGDDRGVLRERGDARAARRRRRGRGVSIGERRRDVVYSPGERVVPRAARVRRLRASRADETGVHARRHRDRPGVVARARAALLREQAEERVREARGRGDDVVVTLGF
mmetsp:Transcript_5503/g.19890  ORF Transcript_5503/g.19890 Transcript_5503/m.19890 type:complete len:218 (+) Transcript_5503:1363-2016(+)